MYRAESDLEEDKLYVYEDKPIEVSSESLEDNKIYIYTNGVLISTKFPEEQKIKIFINESEFYKDKKRPYITGMPSGNFVPEPLKGGALGIQRAVSRPFVVFSAGCCSAAR